jgi:chaperonin GroES
VRSARASLASPQLIDAVAPASGGGLPHVPSPPKKRRRIETQETEMTTKTAKTKLNIHPLGDRVILQRAEAEEKTAGGILLPESAKDKPKEGRVIAIGDGRVLDSGERQKMTVKVGDRVLFTSYAGTEVKYQGEEFLIMAESDILAVIGS